MNASAGDVSVEVSVRFWSPKGEHLWSSACDPDELAEEISQQLKRRFEAGEWVYTTIDYGSGRTPKWRNRWAGRFRLNSAGELEHQPNIEALEAILAAPNPTFERPGDA